MLNLLRTLDHPNKVVPNIQLPRLRCVICVVRLCVVVAVQMVAKKQKPVKPVHVHRISFAVRKSNVQNASPHPHGGWENPAEINSVNAANEPPQSRPRYVDQHVIFMDKHVHRVADKAPRLRKIVRRFSEVRNPEHSGHTGIVRVFVGVGITVVRKVRYCPLKGAGRHRQAAQNSKSPPPPLRTIECVMDE